MRIEQAVALVTDNAYAHQDRTPTLGMLMEEIAEYVRATEGKHEDPPVLELIQIGGIVVNLLRGYVLEDAQLAMAKRDARKAGERGQDDR
jgi:uncharacterized protein YejL (UPF0352 family)